MDYKKIDRAEDILAQLTESERMEVFNRFCTECGASGQGFTTSGSRECKL